MAMAGNADLQQLLAEGKAALQRGDKAAARTHLTQALQVDDHNEQVWLWLSGAVESPDEQRICLENVLTLNPANTIARRGLDLLNQQNPPAPVAPAPAPAPPPAAPPPPPNVAGDTWTALDAQLPSWMNESPSPQANVPAPAAPPATPVWTAPAAAEEPALPGWMDQVPSAPVPGWDASPGLAPAPPPAWAAPAAAEAQLPDWLDQAPAPVAPTAWGAAPPEPAPAAPPPAWTPAAEAPPAPVVGGAAANWANVVSTLRSSDAFTAPPDTDSADAPEPAPFDPAAVAPGWGTLPGGEYPGAWPPQPGYSPGLDPSLGGVQPFQAPGAPGSPAPGSEDLNAQFATLFGQEGAPPAGYPPGAPPYGQGYGTPAPPYGQEGYGPPAPAPPGYGADGYGATGGYPPPPGAEGYGFPPAGGGYGAGSYAGDPNAYDAAGQLQGSSPSLIGRPPLARSQTTPTIPCPNCGELVTENALSCPRCDYRFYAPCPNCGEYIDTSDPSPTGKDVCPRCSQAVDKLALGRSGSRIGQNMSPRDAVMAASRQRQAQEAAAAAQAVAAEVTTVKKQRRGSALRTIFLLIILVALLAGIFYLYQLGILSTIISSVVPGAAVTPVEPTITPIIGP